MELMMGVEGKTPTDAGFYRRFRQSIREAVVTQSANWKKLAAQPVRPFVRTQGVPIIEAALLELLQSIFCQ